MTKTFKWQLKDIIMVAVLGLIFAVIYLAVLYLGVAVTAVLTPFGLAPFGYEIFYGIWFMGATLAAFIIQKPGVAIVTEFLAAFLEFLMGNMGGPLVLVSGLMQGIGAEAGFAMFRYRRFDMASLCVSGVMSAVVSFAWGFVQNAYSLIAPGVIVAMLVVRIVSAIVFAGLISAAAGKGLAKTGVLKSYALGAKYGTAKVMDDEDEAEAEV
jgi:energy-coupling factor transport system substrate-specific component